MPESTQSRVFARAVGKRIIFDFYAFFGRQRANALGIIPIMEKSNPMKGVNFVSAGDVAPSPKMYTIVKVYRHRSLNIDDTVMVVESPKSDLFLLRTKDMSLHSLQDDNEQYVVLAESQPQLARSDGDTNLSLLINGEQFPILLLTDQQSFEIVPENRWLGRKTKITVQMGSTYDEERLLEYLAVTDNRSLDVKIIARAERMLLSGEFAYVLSSRDAATRRVSFSFETTKPTTLAIYEKEQEKTA